MLHACFLSLASVYSSSGGRLLDSVLTIASGVGGIKGIAGAGPLSGMRSTAISEGVGRVAVAGE